MSQWHQTQYAGYLFDLDGTLIDTAPDINLAQNAALKEFGYQPADAAQTRHWVGHGARALLEQALAAQGADHTHLDAMHQYFLTYYVANIAELSRPYPSVLDTLATLRARGAKLAVVTNKTEALSRTLLTELQLLDHFDLLVGGDTAEHPKPDPAPAVLTCQQLELTAAQVLFVGDSTTDVGCARNFGCPVVCVSYGYNQGTPPDALGADGVIESFAELV
jgi:phosphoglycolate phosphatase